MSRSLFFAPAALALALLIAGCATLAPPVPAAQPGIPAAIQTISAADAPAINPAELGWRDFLGDERLQAIVALALDNNRDLRVATLNVERARAVYSIQHAQQLPAVGGRVELTRTGGEDAASTRLYSAGIGAVGFELDLFGRVSSLSEAALRQYFATGEARRAAQLALVAEVANAYLTLAADRELLRVAQDTLNNLETSFALMQKRFDLGAVSRLNLAQARTLVENARADVARYEGQTARAGHALTLLVGAPLDLALLPQGFSDNAVLNAVPAALPSEVLLRRPDVLAAEQQLRSANANIGAARAAFFPFISLTGSVGMASKDLSDLFSGGSFAWSFLPRVDIPIFQGGRLRANLEVATVDSDIALARYEKAIQVAFREVSDALASSDTLSRQGAAQQAQLGAAMQAQELSQARYDAGHDSFLVLLDARRTLYAAQQALVAIRLAEQSNRVTLYKVLGGGWKDRK